MRSRDGFTIIEVLIVLILIGVVGGFAFMRVQSGLAQARAQAAAGVIAADLKQAHSLAGRRRVPVRISIDTMNGEMAFRIRDMNSPDTIYVERHFTHVGEQPVDRFRVSDTSRVVYPNGLADGELTLWVRAGEERRQIHMTRAGMVRVTEQ